MAFKLPTVKTYYFGGLPTVKKPSANNSSYIDMTLNSEKWKYTEKQLPKTARDIQLLKQYSKSKCIKGQTFGLTPDGRKVWVNKGCRGKFRVFYGSPSFSNQGNLFQKAEQAEKACNIATNAQKLLLVLQQMKQIKEENQRIVQENKRIIQENKKIVQQNEKVVNDFKNTLKQLGLI